jgi:hypothetical protein
MKLTFSRYKIRISRALNRLPVTWRTRAVYGLWLLAVIMLGYVIALSVSTTAMFRAVSNLERVEQQFSTGDPLDKFTELQSGFEELDRRLTSFEGVLGPVNVVCGITSIIPFFDNNCTAYETSISSLTDSVGAAQAALIAGSDLDQLVSRVLNEGVAAMSLSWRSEVLAVRNMAAESELAAGDASEITQLHKFQLPFANSSRERVILFADSVEEVARFARLSSDVMLAASDVSSELPELMASLDAATTGTSQFEKIETVWSEISVLLAGFDNALAHAEESVPESLADSSLQQQLVSTRQDLNIVIDLAQAISTTLFIVKSGTEESTKIPGSFLSEGGLAVFSQYLLDNRSSLRESANVIGENTELLLGGSRSSALFAEVGTSQALRYFENNSQLFDLLADLPDLLSEFAALEGRKRYLVLGQSPAELRPLGGFTSGVWFLEFENGVLTKREYRSVLKFGESEALTSLPNPPLPLVRYMSAGAWYLRDVGWSPDFPTVAKLVLQMNQIAGNGDVDGVIAVNQRTFTHLVAALGGIEIDEASVSPMDVDQLLEERTDTEGTEFLDTVFESLIDGFSTQDVGADFIAVVKSLLSDLDARNLMIYSPDEQLAKLMSLSGWDGELRIGQNDVVAIFDSNIGWNKVDVNVAKSAEYRIAVHDDGSIRTTITAEYVNNSNDVAPGCDTHQTLGAASVDYAELKNGCYWNYARAYIPSVAYDVSISSLPISESAMAVSSGAMIAGAPTGNIGLDEAGAFVGGVVTVAPGESATFTAEYSLPPGTALRSGQLEYVMDLIPQPGMLPRGLDVTIEFPVGYTVLSAPESIGSDAENIVRFKTEIDNVRTITAVASKLLQSG